MENNSGSARSFGARHQKRAIGWLFAGLAVLLIAAVFVLPLAFYGAAPVRAYGFYPFIFPFGFFFLFFIGFFVLRLLFWGRGWGGGWGWRGGYNGGYGGWGNYPDAAEVLRMRYAKGEITREQLDQMMKDLSSYPSRPS